MISCRYGSHLRPHPALYLQHSPSRSGMFGIVYFPSDSSCPVGCAKSQHERLASVYGPSLSKSVRCACVLCECVGGLGWGVGVSLYSHYSVADGKCCQRPACPPAHPCPAVWTSRLEEMIERIWDPGGGWIQRNLRDRSPEAYLQPTGRPLDNPSWYGSLKSTCWVFLKYWGSVKWELFNMFAFLLLNKTSHY